MYKIVASLRCAPETNTPELNLLKNGKNTKYFRAEIISLSLASLTVTSLPKDNYAEKVLCHL